MSASAARVANESSVRGACTVDGGTGHQAAIESGMQMHSDVGRRVHSFSIGRQGLRVSRSRSQRTGKCFAFHF